MTRVLYSQYLIRMPLSRSLSRRCYYCDTLLRVNLPGDSAQFSNSRTRDHIHLASRAPLTPHRKERVGEIWNFRWCCANCNQWRNKTGHCCGMLMMVLMEARMTNVSMEGAWLRLDRRALEIKREAVERRRVTFNARQDAKRTALTYGV